MYTNHNVALVLLALLATFPTAATAMTMPSLITSGYFTCVGSSSSEECIVPSPSVTLSVQSMVLDAFNAGNASASFTAIRPTIAGYLNIVCPMTSALMITPIHILVEDGTNSNSALERIVAIEGILAAQSSVTIRGGTYSATSLTSFLNVVGELGLRGGSFVDITGVNLTSMILIYATAPLYIDEASYVEVSNSSVSSAAYWLYLSAAVSIGSSARLSVRNITSEHVTAAQFFGLLAFSTFSAVDGGKIELLDNVLRGTSTGSSSDPVALFYCVGSLSIISNSSLNVSRNYLNISGSSHAFVFSLTATFQLSNGSVLAIVDNDLHLSSTSLVALVSFAGNVHVSVSSTLSTTHNTYTAAVTPYPLRTPSVYFVLMQFSFAIVNGSEFILSDNVIEVDVKSQLIVLFFKGACAILSMSDVVVARTNLTALMSPPAGTLVAYVRWVSMSSNLEMGNGGRLDLNGNVESVVHTGLQILGFIHQMMYITTATIADNCTISITYNTMTIRTNDTSVELISLLYIGDIVSMVTSYLVVSSNTFITNQNASASRFLSLVDVDAAFSLAAGSAVTITANTVSATLAGISQSEAISVLFRSSSLVSLSNSSHMAIAYNTATIVCYMDVTKSLFYASELAIQSDSHLEIIWNTLHFTANTAISSTTMQVYVVSLVATSNSRITVTNSEIMVDYALTVDGFDLATFLFINTVFMMYCEHGLVSGQSTITVENCSARSSRSTTPMGAAQLTTRGLSLTEQSRIVVQGCLVEACRGDGNILQAYATVSSDIFDVDNGSEMAIRANTLGFVCQGITASLLAVRLTLRVRVENGACISVDNNRVSTTPSESGLALLFFVSDLRVGEGTISLMDNSLTATLPSDVAANIVAPITLVSATCVSQTLNTPCIRIGNNTVHLSLLGTLEGGHLYMVQAVVHRNTTSSLGNSNVMRIDSNVVQFTGNNLTRDGSFGAQLATVTFNVTEGGGGVDCLIMSNNTVATSDLSPSWVLSLTWVSEMGVVGGATLVGNVLLPTDGGLHAHIAAVSASSDSTLALSTCGNRIGERTCMGTEGGEHPCFDYNSTTVLINDCRTVTRSASAATGTFTIHRSRTLSTPVSISVTVPSQTTTPTITITPTPTITTSFTVSHVLTEGSTSNTPLSTTASVCTHSLTATLCEFTDTTFQPPCSIFTASAVGNQRPVWAAVSERSSDSCGAVSLNSTAISVRVPYRIWSGGDMFNVYLRVGDVFASSIIPRGGTLPPTSAISGDEGYAECAVVAATKSSVDGGAAVVTLHVGYTGMATLSSATDTVRFATHSVLRCPVNTSGLTVPDKYASMGSIRHPDFPLSASRLMGLLVVFESAGPEPPALEPTVGTGVAIAAVGSVLTGMSSGLVRGGLASSLRGMMRCDVFDPLDEVDHINNPPMVGVRGLGETDEERSLLVYQRGSVILGILILCTFSATTSCVAGILVCRKRTYSFRSALELMRMPSLGLPVFLVAGEIGSGSAVTMLLYHPGEDGVPRGTFQVLTDSILAIVLLVASWSMFVYYAYVTTLGCHVVPAEVELPTTELEEELLPIRSTDIDITESQGRVKVPRGRSCRMSIMAAVQYMLEPTHDPVLKSNLVGSQAENEAWLHRNFLFVAERRWIAYGAAEALAGSVVDLVEGVPITSKSLTACAFRPATMSMLLLLLVVLLVWKWPFAVRVQQCGGLVITTSLLLASVLVTVNVFVTSLVVEEVAGALLMVASALIAVFALVDLLILLLVLFPFLGVKIGFRPIYLSGVIARIRRDAFSLPSNAGGHEPPSTLLSTLNDKAAHEDAEFNRVALHVLACRLRKTRGRHRRNQSILQSSEFEDTNVSGSPPTKTQ